MLCLDKKDDDHEHDDDDDDDGGFGGGVDQEFFGKISCLIILDWWLRFGVLFPMGKWLKSV